MGKEVGAGPEAAALSSAEPGVGSIGSYLARQRRLRGMSVDELASLTKIPRRSLERLEAGAFDATPDGFARGFVRTVAEALGLDPDQAVNRLLAEPREDEALLRAAARRDHRQLWLWGAAVVAALVGLLVLWQLSTLGRAADAPSSDPVVYRHDAVRALAGEPAPVQETAPEPAPEPVLDPEAEPAPR
jgi:cytoskeletal protein RodZ